jgi:outer membrane protein OmpA-like peptidoglycan-associated protein
MGGALSTGLDTSEPNPETIHREKELGTLSAEQWNDLRPVGELRIAPIEFGRASANLTLDGARELQSLARRLQSFPRFYLRVVGHARTDGDPEANRALAAARAEVTAQFLVSQGLSANRVQAETARQTAGEAGAQAVSFTVGQVPY